MDKESEISWELKKSAELAMFLAANSSAVIERMAAEVGECLAGGGTVFVCGNGGSASQAEHFAGELLGRFKMDRKALPVFALSQSSAVTTAIANDTSYSCVFSRQLEGLGKRGDCLIALSTSGRSPNVIKACETAGEIRMKVLALTGRKGSPLEEKSEVVLNVPSDDTARIQEMHLVVLHLICRIVEKRLFSRGPAAGGQEDSDPSARS
jgi:phosphoheptose isomerase